MSEYIDREAAIKAVSENDCEGYATWAVKSIPAADVREVKLGFNAKKDYPSLFECSICGWECWDTIPCDTETFNFCPNCGADMREEQT